MSLRTRYPGYRGAQVLQFVQVAIATNGIAPSYGELCAALGIGSKAEVGKIVKRLERRGALSRVGAGRVRRIRLP